MIDLIPWWIWLAVVTVAGFTAYRYLGKEAAVAVIAVIASALIYRKGKSNANLEAKEQVKEFVDEYRGVKQETAAKSDAGLDVINNPWLRK